ncbi:hypothetical protein DSM3645_02918 [Blastopirellula marina DSM 3645]|uniref:Uncharacterized protein n=1 Tax=Blastopirellula marina DSM 3645 TaxID=314230 RepID=A3ZVP7_9BACT|nr:hypothetical protein DSM3645_02918 [Blastopirellula marina DSM 3645]
MENGTALNPLFEDRVLSHFQRPSIGHSLRAKL